MKKRYSDEQIIGFLREADAGVSVKDLCRRHGLPQHRDRQRGRYRQNRQGGKPESTFIGDQQASSLVSPSRKSRCQSDRKFHCVDDKGDR